MKWKQRSRPGITLLEVLAIIGIGAVVVLALYFIYRGVTRTDPSISFTFTASPTTSAAAPACIGQTPQTFKVKGTATHPYFGTANLPGQAVAFSILPSSGDVVLLPTPPSGTTDAAGEFSITITAGADGRAPITVEATLTLANGETHVASVSPYEVDTDCP